MLYWGEWEKERVMWRIKILRPRVTWVAQWVSICLELRA